MNTVTTVHRSVRVPVADVVLEADLAVPLESPRGAVLFVHGSGSGRHSPRNRYVADALSRAGLVTVLADLLTLDEERIDQRDATLRFDIEFLAVRVTALSEWITHTEPTAGLGIGLFGASTGAAAALITAARRPAEIRAVVSRGGRPDLADPYLDDVHQPTLLIVGGRDTLVIELNQRAAEKLAGETRVAIVPHATHLFEEPGTLEQVAYLARDWFLRHLQPVPQH